MKQILFCAAFLLTIASCTKSSTSATENSEILRSGKWVMGAYTIKYTLPDGTDLVYDIYDNLDTCRSDDYITFGENYEGKQISGKLKCSGELDEMPFDWSLLDNQKTLMMNNAQFTIGISPATLKGKEYVKAKITKINKKSFTITYDTKQEPYNSLIPTSDTGFFSDTTYYFTQVFNKM